MFKIVKKFRWLGRMTQTQTQKRFSGGTHQGGSSGPSGCAAHQRYCAYPFVPPLLVLTRCPILLLYSVPLDGPTAGSDDTDLCTPAVVLRHYWRCGVGWRPRTLGPSGRLPHPTGVPLSRRGGEPPPSRVFLSECSLPFSLFLFRCPFGLRPLRPSPLPFSAAYATPYV